MDISWSPGQPGLFEFKTVVVKEVNQHNYPKCVSDGYFEESTGGDEGFADRMMPITPCTLNLARSYASYYDPLHQIRSLNLNYPDIHWWFIQSWMKACSYSHIPDCAELKIILDEVKDFVNDIEKQAENAKQISTRGVRLIRP